MKVLYYINGLQIGGAETVVTNYLLQLDKISVVLVVDELKGTFLEKRLFDNGIRIIELWPKRKRGNINRAIRSLKIRSMNYKSRWSEIIRDENPDLIHIHTFLDRIAEIDFPVDRIIYSFHSDVNRSISNASQYNNKMMLEKAKQGMIFFALSSKMASDISKIYNTDKISIVPNGINLQKIRSESESKDKVLDELHIEKGAFIVGHVGRFNKVKNHKMLIDIFTEIHYKINKAHLLLIGTGSAEEIATVKDIIEKNGMNKYVHLLGIREDATALMSVMDLFVLPSFSESFSLVLIEAQAHGIRCIASDVVPEEVVCNKNCITLSLNESPAAWAEAALSERENPNPKDLDFFSMDRVIAGMLNIYSRVLNGASK